MDAAFLLLLGLAAGAAAAWLARGVELRARLADARALADERVAAAERHAAEKVALLDEARELLGDTFKALSADALQASRDSFLALARGTLERQQESARGDLERRQQAIGELVAPVKDALGRLDAQVRELERRREEKFGGLEQRLAEVAGASTALRAETARLATALRAPHVRGRWGELQLRRVVELAGMLDRCDFFEQQTAGPDEARLRPDLLVRLPGGKTIVVDAKAPLAGYLDAVEATDEAERRRHLERHARHVRDHAVALSRKAYWEQFAPAPEFVVLFLPGESFFAAALEADPALLEETASDRVVLATPTTLIALLKAAAYGWRQDGIERNALEVAALGRELYARIGDLGGHVAKLGRSLGQSVEHFNRAVGSLESRVLVQARRFEALDAAPDGERLDPVAAVDVQPRVASAPELAGDERR